jgi:hypothetical protein
MTFPDGQRLVPYRVADRELWGDQAYSTTVSTYADNRSDQFTLPGADNPQLDRQWWDAQFERVKTAAIIAGVGCVVLWFLSTVIGWIVRGFMSIPMGHDTRP